jgi:hypothetical protein
MDELVAAIDITISSIASAPRPLLQDMLNSGV